MFNCWNVRKQGICFGEDGTINHVRVIDKLGAQCSIVQRIQKDLEKSGMPPRQRVAGDERSVLSRLGHREVFTTSLRHWRSRPQIPSRLLIFKLSKLKNFVRKLSSSCVWMFFYLLCNSSLRHLNVQEIVCHLLRSCI